MGTMVHELTPIVDENGQPLKPKKGESTLDYFNRKLLADLSTKDEEVRVARGGKGGKGSAE